MHIQLPTELMAFVEGLVKNGEYPSTDVALADFVQLEKDRRLVEEALLAEKNGEVLDGPTAIRNLRAEFKAKRKSAGRKRKV